jgi:hypothetical protein
MTLAQRTTPKVVLLVTVVIMNKELFAFLTPYVRARMVRQQSAFPALHQAVLKIVIYAIQVITLMVITAHKTIVFVQTGWPPAAWLVPLMAPIFAHSATRVTTPMAVAALSIFVIAKMAWGQVARPVLPRGPISAQPAMLITI